MQDEKTPKYPRNGRYTTTWAPLHSRAKISGMVSAHNVIAERVLGKPLPLKAVVHHINGDSKYNKRCNLVICEDEDYHKLLHLRMRALRECGHVTWRKCWICKKWDAPETLIITTQVYHRGCHNAYNRKRWRIRNEADK